MALVTDLSADTTAAHTITHLAGMTMVPVLIHELVIGHCECTYLI